nr:zinc-ribbon domain containing protein [Dehalococcoides mccartyi]
MDDRKSSQLFSERRSSKLAYQDKEIQCADCGASFTFTASEQELYASRGYTNDPKRCVSCRQARKAERGGSTGGFGGMSRGPARQMFQAVCAQCGQDTEVPFEPRQGRPVYCSNCYNRVKGGR